MGSLLEQIVAIHVLHNDEDALISQTSSSSETMDDDASQVLRAMSPSKPDSDLIFYRRLKLHKYISRSSS